ncbi:DUF1376 domain-containing protein [Bartonella taylorii]|uniref:DUF1376 domain-containing protein n=1 Tax=Bartonella taylorii TaxID=33046 RepID=UPI001ABB8A36|nr:DUF1376 domain-containing protein [Bartonella taylorii]
MSSKIPWTRLNTDQWLFKLSDLPPMEVNVYVKLRIRMLHTREPLLNDSRILSHFTCCSVKRFQKALEYLFRSGHIICLEDGRLWSSDVEEELNNSNENLNKFSERAQKAAQAKWAKHHKAKTISDDQDAKHDAKAMLNYAINNNNNIYNKKTKTIVLAKKEIGSESLETNEQVDEPTEVAAVETTSEQITTGVDNQPPIHEQENVPEKAKRAKANRGCRLPADFEPDYDFAIAEGLPPERVKVEIAKFRDYWRSKAGANATKIDWQATWRNWVRKAIDDLEKGKNYGNHSQRQKSVGERIADSILDIGNQGYFEAHSCDDTFERSVCFEGWQPINETAGNDSFRSL